MIATSAPKIDYDAVAWLMGESKCFTARPLFRFDDTTDCTAKAVSHRIGRIRELAKGLDGPGAGAAPVTTISTPTRKRATPKSQKTREGADGHGHEHLKSPTKKQKRGEKDTPERGRNMTPEESNSNGNLTMEDAEGETITLEDC